MSTLTAGRGGVSRLVLVLLAAVLAVAALAGVVPGRAARAATAPAAAAPPLTFGGVTQLPKVLMPSTASTDSAVCPTPAFCVVVSNDGSLVTVANPAGSSPAWSQPVSLGAVIVKCPAATFCVAENQALGRFYASADPAKGKSAWHESGIAKPLRLESCPAASFCVASNGAREIATTTDPSARRPSWQVIHAPVPGSLSDVSCPSATFCVAAGTNGEVLTSARPAGAASAWKAAHIDGSYLISGLSCPSASFCLALDSLGRFVYSTDPAGGASHWHLANEPAGGMRSVLCLSANLCFGIEDSGEIASSADPAGGPEAWQATSIDGYSAAALSCPAAGFCAAATGSDLAISSSPASSSPGWTMRPVVDQPAPVSAVDCPSATFCVAGDSYGRIFTSSDPGGGPGAWTTADVYGTRPIMVISCATRSFCAALGFNGDILTSTDPAGGAAAWHLSSGPSYYPDGLNNQGLSCPSASLCVASGIVSGPNGVAWVSTDPAGGASAWHEVYSTPPSLADVPDITCASTSLCVATTDSGLLVSTDPAAPSWAAVSGFGLTHLEAASCPSATLCVLTGFVADPDTGEPTATYVLTSTDPAGGLAGWNEHKGPAAGLLDCPSTAECYQFNDGKQNEILTTTDPSSAAPSWVASPGPSTYLSSQQLSCPLISLCVAASGSGIQLGTPPARGASAAALRLSAARIRYGHERSEHLTVTVVPRYPQYKRVPTGTVVIMTSSGAAICTRALDHGKAACTLSGRQLAPGTHWLRVRYRGSRGYVPSQSGLVRLRVTG